MRGGVLQAGSFQLPGNLRSHPSDEREGRRTCQTADSSERRERERERERESKQEHAHPDFLQELLELKRLGRLVRIRLLAEASLLSCVGLGLNFFRYSGAVRHIMWHVTGQVDAAGGGRDLRHTIYSVVSDQAQLTRLLTGPTRLLLDQSLSQVKRESLLGHFIAEAAELTSLPVHILSDIDMTVWVGTFGAGGGQT